jgi:GNAT superfamily N-acetyltransferase
VRRSPGPRGHHVRARNSLPIDLPIIPVRFEVSPKLTKTQLNRLYFEAWPHHKAFNFTPVLKRSLCFVCAYDGKNLVGFVYLAWDGAQHAFLLEPTVTPRLRRRGIGRELVQRAVEVARSRGCEWIHVDYEVRLASFYRSCGFRPTTAGLIRLAKPKKSLPRSR